MKRFFASATLAIALILAPNLAFAQHSEAHNLSSDIFGNKRILLVCSTGIVDPIERILPKMDWQGFAERDLVIVAEGSAGIEMLNADGSRSSLSDRSRAKIQQSMRCDRGIDFNLIGKDGGVKKQFSDVVWVENLYATIDAMPMRRFEMRQRQRQRQRQN
jgi:hypothetical protein